MMAVDTRQSLQSANYATEKSGYHQQSQKRTESGLRLVVDNSKRISPLHRAAAEQAEWLKLHKLKMRCACRQIGSLDLRFEADGIECGECGRKVEVQR